jgi:undecaprenyl-diphosphatase
LLVAASVIAAALLIDVLKAVFGRLRPDAAYADFLATGLSFPSGHSSMSAIVFLTVGALLASKRSRLAERRYILATTFMMTFLIGLSRVALGVHWATDVLGGWAFGAAWALAWLMLAHQIATKKME